MGESVTYAEILNESIRGSVQQNLTYIQDQIAFYGFLMAMLVPLTCMVNGLGLDQLMKTKDGSYALALINHCQIGIDTWYITFTVLCGVKLLVQLIRFTYMKSYQKESVLFNVGGNYIVLPLLFAGFFIYTQGLFEKSTPDVKQILSIYETFNKKV